MTDWLALVIGNTRWHWAWFRRSDLQQVWHTDHLSHPPPADITLQSIWSKAVTPQIPPQILDLPLDSIAIWAVSVVPTQAQYLQPLSQVQWIHHVGLKNTYPTMGLDRVVTLWGAGQRYGWPVLVIDGGTALTFTAGAEETFVGGAILLGVRSHLAALHHATAALPSVSPPTTMPPRWANDTPGAIQSGVILTVLASIDQYIQSWQQQYPESTVIFTGGDGNYLHRFYQQTLNQNQALLNRAWFDPNLMFWGIAHYRKEATRAL
ncbi:pantothenate kinase [Leptothoe sp. PORK10 BA2]|uniref:pantothenate kinase n=1 Tax=Leptothoe sp. PORK10 BA2 TaxID=3110254 RepID=UPI002B21C175|nr:pantothenate kinase [Leptothoe sp. PORK10 BA2]MEA5462222.1 pantothenate kinase [Leptothoe sp. PORK10 BA2]